MEHSFAKLYTASLEKELGGRLSEIVGALRMEMYLGGVRFDSFQPHWTIPEAREGITPLESREGIALLFRDGIPFAVITGAVHPYVDLYISDTQPLGRNERSLLFNELEANFGLRKITHRGIPQGSVAYEITRDPQIIGAGGLDDLVAPSVIPDGGSVERADRSHLLLARVSGRFRDAAFNPMNLGEEDFISDTMVLLHDTLRTFGSFVLHDCRNGAMKEKLQDALLVRHCLDQARNRFSTLIATFTGRDIDCLPIVANDLKNDVDMLNRAILDLFRPTTELPNS